MNFFLIFTYICTGLIFFRCCILLTVLIHRSDTKYILNNQLKIWTFKLSVLYLIIFIAVVSSFVSTSDSINVTTKNYYQGYLNLFNNILIVIFGSSFYYDIFRAGWTLFHKGWIVVNYYLLLGSCLTVSLLSIAGIIILSDKSVPERFFGYMAFSVVPFILSRLYHKILCIIESSSEVDKYLFRKEDINMTSIMMFAFIWNVYQCNIFYISTLNSVYSALLSGCLSLIVTLSISHSSVDYLESKIVETIFRNDFTANELQIYNLLKSGKLPTSTILENNEITKLDFIDYKTSLISSDEEYFVEDEVKNVEDYLRKRFFFSENWKQMFYKDPSHYGLPVHETNFDIFMARCRWEITWYLQIIRSMRRIRQRFGGYTQIVINEESELENDESKNGTKLNELEPFPMIHIEEQ